MKNQKTSNRAFATSPSAFGYVGRLFLAAISAALLSSGSVQAAGPYYWTTTGTNTWSAGLWSTTSTSGGTTGVNPTIASAIVFNQSTVNGPTTVQLNAAQGALGITFNNTGTTLLDSSSSTPQILSIGASGITVASGAGTVTIGDPTNVLNVSITNQTWTNNSSNTLSVLNGISDSAAATLTFAGSGNITLSGPITNGTAALALTDNSTGILTIGGNDTYTGATSVSSGTLSLTGTLNGTSGITLSGNGAISESAAGSIAGTAGITQSSTGFSNLAGVNTTTGTLVVNQGTLQIDFSGTNSGAPGRVNSLSPLQLGTTLTGTATFQMLGTSVAGQSSVQTLAGTGLKSAESFTISAISGSGGGNSATLNLGAFTRNQILGSTLNLVLPTSGSITTTSTNGNSILGGYFTVNGTDWAVSGGPNAVTPPTFAITAFNGYAVANAATTAIGNGNVDFQASNTTAWATQTVNTLRFNTAASTTLTLATGGTLTLSAGGILETANVGAHTTTISGGTLTTGRGAVYATINPGNGSFNPAVDLVITQNNTAGGLNINSIIADYPLAKNALDATVINNSTATTAVTKTGAGVVTLAGANTYSGSTYLDQGALVVGSSSVTSGGVLTSGALGTGTLRMDPGTELDDNGSAITLANSVSISYTSATFGGTGSLTFDGTSLTAPATFALTQATALTVNNTTTIKDTITGGKALTLNGTGTLVLTLPSNVANYGADSLGGITINSTGAGSLELGSNYVITSGNNSVTINQTNGLTFAAGVNTPVIQGLNGTATETLQDTGGGAVNLSVGWNNTGGAYSGILTGSGGLTKLGTGTQNLTGANNYTGATTVVAGTLNIGNGGTLSSSSTLVLGGGGGGGTLQFSAAGTNTLTFAGLTVNSGQSGVNSSVATDTIALNGITHNPGGMVNFTNTGLISTTTGNDATGILGTWATIGSGTTLSYATVNGSNDLVAYGSGTAAGTGLVSMTSAGTNYSTTTSANTVGGNLTGNTLQFGATTAAGTVTLGTNSLTLNGLMNSGIGLVTIQGNTGSSGLVIGSSGELDISSNTQGFAISSVISGTGTLVYGGPLGATGTLNLSGANTFNGPTIINQGALTLANTSALGGSTGLTLNMVNGTLNLLSNATGTFTGSGGGALATTINNSETINVNNLTAGTGNTLTLGAMTLGSVNSIATLTVNSANTYNLAIGAVTLTGNASILPNTGNITSIGAISGSGWNLTLGGAATENGTVGAINLGTTGNLTLSGTSGSVWSLNGASIYNGLTISTGTLSVSGNYLDSTSGVTFGNGTSPDLVISASNTVGSLSGGASATNNVTLGSGATLTTGADNSNQTFAGAIGGAGNLTKVGTGTQFLTSGSGSYTGVTTINGGILNVGTFANGGSNSSIGASTSAASNLVINGGTLQYTGSSVDTNRVFTIGNGGATLDSSGPSSTTNSSIWFTSTGSLATSTTVANTPVSLTLTGSRYNNFQGTVNPGYSAYNLFNPAINNNGTGATSLIKNGPGLWVINGSGTYTNPGTIDTSSAGGTYTGSGTFTGGTTVNAGALEVQTPYSLGKATFVTGSAPYILIQNSPTVAAGATLILNALGTSVAQQLAGNTTTSDEFSALDLASFFTHNTGNFAAGSTLGLDFSDLTGSNGTTPLVKGTTSPGTLDYSLGYNGNITLNNVNLGFFNLTGNKSNVEYVTMSGNISLGTGGIQTNHLNYGSGGAYTGYELMGTNTYSGATTLYGGALIIGSAGALGQTSAIVASDTGYSTSQSKSVLGVDTSTLTSVNAGNPFVITAPLIISPSSVESVATFGLGFFTNTTNSTSGAVFMPGSSDFTFNNYVLGSNPSTGASEFIIGGGSGSTSTGLTTFNGPIYISNGTAGSGTESFVLGTSNADVVNGVISDTASGPLTGVTGNFATNNNAETVYLNGNNTYTGTTSMFRGTLVISSLNNDSSGTQMAGSSLGRPSSVANGVINVAASNPDLIVDVGTGESSNRGFLLNGNNTFNFQQDGSGALNLSGNIGSVATGNANFSFQGFNTEGNTYSGAISDGQYVGPISATSLIKAGSGAWTVSSTASTYTGTTTISAGTLNLGSANALGLSGANATYNSTPNGVVINSTNGGTLNLNGNTISKQINLAGGALVNNNTTTASSVGNTATVGTGLAGLSLTGTGTGLSAPPTVTITGGGGSGATAQVLLGLSSSTFAVPAGGTGYSSGTITFTAPTGGVAATGTVTIAGGVVTGIVITNPGYGYTTAPVSGATANGYTLTLVGGSGASVTDSNNFGVGLLQLTNAGSGYTSAPTISYSSGSGIVSTANLASINITANSSIGGNGSLTINPGITGGAFGITKIGSGTTTLAGVSTYTGGTTVNAGTLQVGNGTTGSIAAGSALTLGGGTLYLKGTGSALNQTFASLTTSTASASTITIDPNGSTTASPTVLTLTATGTRNNGGALNFNYGLGTTNGATLGNDYVTYTTAPGLTGGIISGLYTVTDAGGTGFATITSKNVVRLTGQTALVTNGGTSTVNYIVNTNTSSTTAGSLVEQLSGGVVAQSLTADTTALSTGANLDLNGKTLTISTVGGILFTGANSYQIQDTAGGGAITGSAGNGSLTFENYNTSASGVTISAPITGLATGLVTFAGPGITNLSGANTYGGTTYLDGGTLNLANSGALGGLGAVLIDGGTITNTSGAAFSSANSASINNSFTFGAAGQTSANNLTLSGNGAFSSSLTQTITLAGAGTTLTLGGTWSNSLDAAQTLTVNGAGNTLVLSALNLDSGGNTATMQTITGSGNLTISGILGNGSSTAAQSLMYNGTGTLTLNGANTYGSGTAYSLGATYTTGETVIAQGTVIAGTSALSGTITPGTATLGTNTSGAFGDSNTALVLGSNSLTGAVSLLANGVTIGRNITEETTGPLTNSAVLIGGSNTSGTANYTGTISLAATTTLVAAAGGTTDFNDTWATNNNALLIGTTSNTGTVELDNAISTTGGVTAQFGTLALTGTVTSPLTVTGTASVTQTSTGTLVGSLNNTSTGTSTFSGAITNNGTITSSVTQAGTGNLVLAGANTYTGATSVKNGTLTVNGSTSTGTVTVGGFSGGGATAILGGTGTIGGPLVTSSANSNVAHIAPGAVTGTVGTLHVGNLGFTIGSGTMFDYDLNSVTTAGGTSNDLVSMAGGVLTFSGTTTFNFDALSALSTSGSYTLISGASSVSGFNASNFLTTGTGTLTATFSNSGGTVFVSFAAPVISIPTVAYFNGQTADLNTFANYDTTSSSGVAVAALPTGTTNVYFSANRNVAVTASTSAPLSVNSLNFGVGTGTNSGISITGTSAITITGSNVNGTTGNQGITTTGTGSDSISAPIVLGASQTWLVASGGTLTVSGSVSGSGDMLTKDGAGVLILTGTNTYSGGTTIALGTLQIGNGGTGATIGSGAISNSGTLVFDLSTAYNLTNSVSGTGSILDIGTGVLTLSGSNSSTGATTINAGTLSVGSTSSLSSGAISLANGTGLQYTGTTSGTLVQNISITGTTGSTGVLTNTGGSVLTLAGTINKNGTTLNFGSGTFVVTGTITGTSTHSDLVVGSSSGGATVGLTTANSYNGPTTIYNGSTLLTGTTGALPTATPSDITLGSGTDGAVTNTLDLLGTSQTVASITSSGTATTVNRIISSNGSASTPAVGSGASSSTGNLTVNYTGTTTDTYTGSLGGSGAATNFSLTKSGTGTLALTNANTYSGGTTVSAGTLMVSNATGSATGTGNLSVMSGATLSGTGTVNASGVTVASGGTVRVGNGGTTDILTMTSSGTINLSSANLTFNLNSAVANQSSELAFGNTSSVLFGSTNLTLNLNGNTLIGTPTGYTLFTSTATSYVYSGLTLSGSFITAGLNVTLTGTNAGNYGGVYFELVGNGSGGDNIVAVVPEPSTWALMLGGLALLVIYQRRRRNKNS